MSIESKIVMTEGVENTERTFGEIAGTYYPAYLVGEDGSEQLLMFTENDLKKANERAMRNPEDMPEDKSFFEKLFFG